MQAEKYLRLLQKDIHSAVAATVDAEGRPCSCVVDVMLVDEKGLYFLTAKGKALYDRLLAKPDISITGFSGTDTMRAHSVTVRGKVRAIGSLRIGEIFEENPYMAQIYPSTESRKALAVFQLYEGTGEFFDLSQKPIFREQFSFGGARTIERGYTVGADCIGCGRCFSVCPQKCIDAGRIPAVIDPTHCLHCGRCADVCPKQTIQKRG